MNKCDSSSIAAPELQAERRNSLFACHRGILPDIFSPEGVYTGVKTKTPLARVVSNDMLDPRVCIWHAFAAFAGDDQDIALGNGILRNTAFLPDYDFGMSALLHLWRRFEDRFEPDVRQKAEDAFERTGSEQMESPGFVGMNDNFAAMACAVLVHAGEITGRHALIEKACADMRGIVSRLDSHGAIAEFNSPTYSPLTQCCMAEIVNFSRHEEARALARRIEEQTWCDICARYHSVTANMTGPSSRSYMSDSCGHMHNARFLFYLVFGEAAGFFTPLEYSYGKRPGLILHHGEPTFIPANGAWVIGAEYHPPEVCVNLMASRPDVFDVTGTAAPAALFQPDEWRRTTEGPEHSRFRPFTTFRYGDTLMTTHMTKHYAVGSSSGAMACQRGGQHDAFFITWSRTEAPGDVADVRTLFSRYVFQDVVPSDKSSLLSEQGWPSAVQRGNVSLVCYRPGDEIQRDITGMKVSLVMPVHCSVPDELWFDNTRQKELSSVSEEPVTVFVRDGLAVLAFRPLDITDYGRKAAVRVRRLDSFLLVDFINYEGPPRSLNFGTMAALFTANGFVCEIDIARDDAEFSAFRQRVLSADVKDGFYDGKRMAGYERPGCSLRVELDPADVEHIPPAWIDGTPRPTPRFKCSDFIGELKFDQQGYMVNQA